MTVLGVSIPLWLLVLPGVAIWFAALIDVARDRTVGADARLWWGVFLVVLPSFAPLRFLLRRRVRAPRPTTADPTRAAYTAAVEAARGPHDPNA